MKGRPVKTAPLLTQTRVKTIHSGRLDTGTISVGIDRDSVPIRRTEVIAGSVPSLPPSRPMLSNDISVLWHELLSPITLIKAYTSTLLQMNSTINLDQQVQYIQGIDSASNRLVRLLESLRDITRLEETEIIRDQTISLLELLQKMLAEMQLQTSRHTIKLHPHAPLPRIRVAPEKIEQVITNLITNAIKYSPHGGHIDVDIRFTRTDLEASALYPDSPLLKTPCYVVSVADSGLGIPEEDIFRIFEKFYRVNNKLVRTSPGAGLGLYICRVIVDAHGGRIWAVNRPQGGSIFNFSLPFDMQEHQGW